MNSSKKSEMPSTGGTCRQNYCLLFYDTPRSIQEVINWTETLEDYLFHLFIHSANYRNLLHICIRAISTWVEDCWFIKFKIYCQDITKKQKLKKIIIIAIIFAFLFFFSTDCGHTL